MVQSSRVTVSNPIWVNCSQQSKNLLERMLQTDPAKRISAKEIIIHPWISGEKQNQHTVLEMMKKYRSEVRWKKAVYAIYAINRLKKLALEANPLEDLEKVIDPKPIKKKVSKIKSSCKFKVNHHKN